MDVRLGNGYDVHAFEAGDNVILCGVRIPHHAALRGHSDADVGMHAVTDAIYGALAQGDIGRHFPPSDPQWKGAASDIFLRHAGELAREMGYEISHRLHIDLRTPQNWPTRRRHAKRIGGHFEHRRQPRFSKGNHKRTIGLYRT